MFLLKFELKFSGTIRSTHEKVCYENQHAFIQFLFDIFAFLAPEIIDLLRRVQNVMYNNIECPRSRWM
jgi:hypothetical protein